MKSVRDISRIARADKDKPTFGGEGRDISRIARADKDKPTFGGEGRIGPRPCSVLSLSR
jgi:hypothetical protein